MSAELEYRALQSAHPFVSTGHLRSHQQLPDDLIILGQLINAYSEMGELEKAMVLAEKLESSAQRQNNAQQLVNARLYQSGILTHKDLFELSARKLSLAVEQFEAINDLSCA